MHAGQSRGARAWTCTVRLLVLLIVGVGSAKVCQTENYRPKMLRRLRLTDATPDIDLGILENDDRRPSGCVTHLRADT